MFNIYILKRRKLLSRAESGIKQDLDSHLKGILCFSCRINSGPDLNVNVHGSWLAWDLDVLLCQVILVIGDVLKRNTKQRIQDCSEVKVI